MARKLQIRKLKKVYSPQIAYPQNVTFYEGQHILVHKCEVAIFETFLRTAHVMESKIRSDLPICLFMRTLPIYCALLSGNGNTPNKR
jgi:hypothetical protein